MERQEYPAMLVSFDNFLLWLFVWLVD